MASIKLLLAVAIVACLAQQYYAQQCTASSSITTCTVPVIFYDQAPATMAHWRYPQRYFWVNDFYDFPSNGSCGTANGGMGFAMSDFEQPLYLLQGYLNYASSNLAAHIINGETGLVGPLCTKADGSQTNCGVLNPTDRTPIYAYGNQRSKTGQISNSTTFYDFFHLTPQTKAVPFNLTLTQDAKNPRLRSFDDPMFFPLDGKGWNDQGPAPTGPGGSIVGHNFAFCMVMHTHFTYSGGETFYFIGDDDVYAYINGFLVMDIGGVHTAINGTINVDTLGLSKGSYNSFDFFYCERHSTSSEIAFETTIDFFCAYTDWCGVCDGDGQSCCANQCNDNNACTVDYCDVFQPPPGGCHYNQTKCPANTPCTTYTCNKQTGNCDPSAVICNDFSDCTTDSCGAAGCQYLPIDCTMRNNSCVTTGCNAKGGCYSNPVTCQNSNKCQSVSCNPAVGCVTQTLPCVASDKCHTAACDPNNGCVQTDISSTCNDNNVCTNDACDPSFGCRYTPKNLSAVCSSTRNDVCQQNACDSKLGCVTTNLPCAAPDKCSIANCDPVGGCIIRQSVFCTSNACFNSACNPSTGLCVQTPKPACPGKTCFNATCNNSTGCVYAAVQCPTGSNCTSSTCSNNVCTAPVPTGVAGCPQCNGKTCDVTDPCNPYICTSGVCVLKPVNCDDSNACTTDKCVANNGVATCQHTPLNCTGIDACHPASCVNGACVFNNVTCNDNNLCTTDACVPNLATNTFQCTFTPQVCTTNDSYCNPVKCDGGQCVADTANTPDCSDGNLCTLDICTPDGCTNPPVCTDAGTLCNPIACVAGVCVATPVNCATGNNCTIDYCDEATGQCHFDAVNCNGTTCNPSTCDPGSGACVVPTLIDCNDANPCTLDARECQTSYGFTCNNTDMSYTCNDSNVCTLDYCNASSTSLTTAGACYHTNVTCAPPTPCQVLVGCDAVKGCLYAPKNCTANITDYCQIGVCDAVAGCITVARACVPNDNFCFAGFCDNVTKTCGQQQRPNWQTITNQNKVTCLLAYNTAAKAGLTAGILAAIIIAAVIAAALIIFAGKKGVDIYMASRAAPIGGASNNPLYAEAPGSGTSALYGR